MDIHADALASFLRDRLGDNLRAVGYYRGGDDEWIYLRDDLSPAYSPELLEQFIAEARTVHASLETVSRAESPLGTARASLHTFEGALLAHFLLGESTGVLVSFEPDVGGRLQDFVERCQGILEEGHVGEESVTRTADIECDPQAAE
ncbi:MAG: hypothetical protein R3324_10585 [Halobacteriales archaeon]|nr:hypothetical protein [Halobacteriales archaeon]